MAKFAQYYIRYKHESGAYEWDLRQQHLSALFAEDGSIEFRRGEEGAQRLYKHRVKHLECAPGIIVMRFANDIDIPVERDFEPAMAKDEPSCFVIIDNRDGMRSVAIQKRRKAFGNTRQVASILSEVIDGRLYAEHCYGLEILPDYYPEDLFKVWEQKQQTAQALRFVPPQIEKQELMERCEVLKSKGRTYYDDSLMASLWEVMNEAKKAKYKPLYTIIPEERKTALYVDKTTLFMRNLLTMAEAMGEPVELVTKDGGTFRCFIDSDEDNTDKIVSHDFNANQLELLFRTHDEDGNRIEPEDRIKAEGETLELMNGMKHEAGAEEEQVA